MYIYIEIQKDKVNVCVNDEEHWFDIKEVLGVRLKNEMVLCTDSPYCELDSMIEEDMIARGDTIILLKE